MNGLLPPKLGWAIIWLAESLEVSATLARAVTRCLESPWARTKEDSKRTPTQKDPTAAAKVQCLPERTWAVSIGPLQPDYHVADSPWQAVYSVPEACTPSEKTGVRVYPFSSATATVIPASRKTRGRGWRHSHMAMRTMGRVGVWGSPPATAPHGRLIVDTPMIDHCPIRRL